MLQDYQHNTTTKNPHKLKTNWLKDVKSMMR